MIRPDLSKWDYKQELQGLLIFAQAVDEMLFHHTSDTYKAPALNIRTNIIELRFLAMQLFNKRVKLGTIEPVIEELGGRLKQDILVRRKHRATFSFYFKRIEELKARPQELIPLLDALLSELDSFYWEDLLSNIGETVNDVQRKADITTLAHYFITEAEFHRFSRGSIYYRNQGFFFRPDAPPKKISSTTQIVDFLAPFNQNPTDWQVIFRGSSGYGALQNYAQTYGSSRTSVGITATAPATLPADMRKKHKFLTDNDSSLPLFLVVEMSDANGIRDHGSARDYAKAEIDVLSDIYSFVAHHEQEKISDDALVINKTSGENSILQPTPNPMKCGIQRQSGDEADAVMQLFIDIVKSQHFDVQSSRLFIKSLDFHRAALEAKTPENQLLDLWAALEGFVPTPPEDGARVAHYMNTLIPSLTLTYPEKIFRYLADSIFHGGGKCRSIIDSVTAGSDFFTRVVATVTCDELRDKRELLYGELEEHALLRHRIYEVYEMFKTKKRIKNSIDVHRQRVAWHIQRIYTTRNQIIHNAESLPYLRTLVENLHSYFDILVETTSVIALLSRNKISTRAALGTLNVHEQSYLNSLDGDDEGCTTENFLNLVFGIDNPIAPFNSGIALY